MPSASGKVVAAETAAEALPATAVYGRGSLSWLGNLQKKKRRSGRTSRIEKW